jgi:hypothetical protein
MNTDLSNARRALKRVEDLEDYLLDHGWRPHGASAWVDPLAPEKEQYGKIEGIKRTLPSGQIETIMQVCVTQAAAAMSLPDAVAIQRGRDQKAALEKMPAATTTT